MSFENLLNRLSGFALNHLLPAALTLLAGSIVIRVLMQLVTKALEKSKLERAAHTLIKSVIRVALYLVLMLTAASALGIDVTGIVALASVLTLAVSLSVQTALTNVIGGFTLLSTKPFVSGDFVEIAGQSGTVREIGLTYTKLATADNKIISIPNNSVVAAQIINFSVSGTRRVCVNISVSYDVPADTAIEALLEAARLPTALADPAPFAAMESYGESTVNYILHIWCRTGDYWTTQFQVNKNIQAVFAQKGIALTYPHLHVHLDK